MHRMGRDVKKGVKSFLGIGKARDPREGESSTQGGAHAEGSAGSGTASAQDDASAANAQGGADATSALEDDANATSAPKDNAGATAAPEDDAGATSAPKDDSGATTAPENNAGATAAPEDDSLAESFLGLRAPTRRLGNLPEGQWAEQKLQERFVASRTRSAPLGGVLKK